MTSRNVMLVVGAMVGLAGSPAAAGPRDFIPYEGFLEQNGSPLNRSAKIQFDIYDDPTDGAGTLLWTDTYTAVPVLSGRFNVMLGEQTALTTQTATLWEYSALYLAITVDDTPLVGRQTLAGPGYLIPKGVIVAWYGAQVPAGWALCDGNNQTPDLTNRFIRGTTTVGTYAQGGSDTIAVSNLPSHSHPGSTIAGTIGSALGNHSHTFRLSTGLGNGGYALEGNNPVSPRNDGTDDTNLAHTHTFAGTVAVAPEGGGTAFVPAHFALAYIMKL